MTAIVRIRGLSEVEVAIDNFASKSSILYNTMLSFVLGIRTDTINNSPVGVGEGAGAFRRNWKIREEQGAGTIYLENDLPYAGPLEQGSPLGGLPWPSPGPRTVAVEGRVRPSQWPKEVAGTAIDQADWSIFNKAVEDMLK